MLFRSEVTVWDVVPVVDAVGVADPVEDVRGSQEWVEPDDVVEPGGYPEALDRLVRVIRDGEIVAVLEYVRNGPETWMGVGGSACSDVVPGPSA